MLPAKDFEFQPSEVRSQGDYFSLLLSVTTPTERAEASLPQTLASFSGCCFGLSVLRACDPVGFNNSLKALSSYDSLADDLKITGKQKALSLFKDAFELCHQQYHASFNALLKQRGYHSLNLFTVAAFVAHRDDFFTILEYFFEKESQLLLGMFEHAILIQKAEDGGFYFFDPNNFHPLYALYFSDLKALCRYAHTYNFAHAKEKVFLDLHLTAITNKDNPSITEKDFFPFIWDRRDDIYINQYGFCENTLSLSAKTGCYKIAKLCLSSLTVRVDEFISNALIAAVEKGHLSFIKPLLEHKEKISGSKESDWLALGASIQKSDFKAINLLLSRERTLPQGAMGLQLIAMAARDPKGKTLKSILRNIEMLDSALLSENCLVEAIKYNSLENVKTLKRYGANFNHNSAPLYFAVIFNRIDIIKYMLAHHADPTVQYNLYSYLQLFLSSNSFLSPLVHTNQAPLVQGLSNITLLEIAVALQNREMVSVFLKNNQVKAMIASESYLQKCKTLTQDPEILSRLTSANRNATQALLLEPAQSFTPSRSANKGKRTFSQSAPILCSSAEAIASTPTRKAAKNKALT